MQNNTIKFDIEEISDIIVERIANVSDPSANTRGKVVNDVQYKHLRTFKKNLGIGEKESIDIIVLAEGIDEDKEVQEIHNRLNFKLNEDPRIATFFHGASNKPFFHFPLGLNIFMVTPEEMSERRSAFNPWIVFNMGLDSVHPLFKSDKNEKYLIVYNVKYDPYFDMEKHVLETWDK